MATKPAPQSDSVEISTKELILIIRTWINYLWSKWPSLLIAGVLGGSVGLGLALLERPEYVASTTFVLESGDSKGGLLRYAGMAAMAGIDIGSDAGGLFQGDNILELYRSRNMIAQTLLSRTQQGRDELLIDRYIEYNEIRNKWKKDSVLYSLDFHENPVRMSPQTIRVRDSIITLFVNAINKGVLQVDKPDKKLSIIKVEVRSPDEAFSKNFNENLVYRVNEFYVQTKIKKSTNNVAILEKKIDSVRTVMTDAIYSAVRASDATPNLNPTRQVQRVVPIQQAQFSAETNRTMLSQLIQNLEMTKMTLLQEQPLIQFVDQPVYPLQVERLGKIKGILIFGFLFGFLTLLFLVAKKWYRDVMDDG